MRDIQLSVENGTGLERRMRVRVPAGRIEQEVESRLRSAARTANIKGFRRGKVPAHIIRQRFGAQIRQEVLQDVLQSSYSEAIAREKLRPAGGPSIETEPAEAGGDLAYTATFEVFPEFEVAGVENLVVEKPQAEITDADVERTIERLCRQRGTWQPVDRDALAGDRVVIDFDGSVDGQPMEAGQAEKVSVVIGEGRMLADFESNLVGSRAGGRTAFSITFPADYYDDKLRGRSGAFDVRIHEVAELQPAPLDEALVKGFGVASGEVAEFRQLVRQNLEREAASKVDAAMRRQVMEQLLAANPVELPAVLVAREAASLQAEGMRNLGIKSVDDAPPLSAYEGIAERRVRLGLIVAGVIRAHEIRLDQELVQRKLDELCRPYDRPEEARRMYLETPELLMQIENSVLEEQVLTWLIGRSEVRDKAIAFAELMDS